MSWSRWLVAGAAAGGLATAVLADDPACPGEGDCLEPNGSPGCNIEDCCKLVCAIDSACCSLEWDSFCVEIAETFPACFAAPPGSALWDNGPLVTFPGGGFGGADVSSVSPGSTLFGGNINNATFRRADDFEVAAGGWEIGGFEFFGYQTNSSTTSTFTGLFIQIWDGVPGEGGQVIWGDPTTNRLSATSFSNIYRTSAAALTNTQRPVMRLIAAGLDIQLAPGTYWVEFGMTGSLASGPWVPPVSDPVKWPVGNSRLFTVGTSTWSLALDGTAPGPQQGYDLPFRIIGEGSSSPCVSSTASCTEAHGTPGCGNAACCGTVCGALPECCSIGWDAACVTAATELCGLYSCPSGNFPANDCPTGASVVAVPSSVNFNSTNASTNGPLQPQCGSTGGDSQIWKDLWYRVTTPGEPVRVVASTCGTASFDTKIAAYNVGDGTFDPETLSTRFVRCNEDGVDCPTGTSRLEFIGAADTTYLIRLGGFDGGSGTGTIAFEFEPLLAPEVCATPGSNPIDSNPTDSLATGGVACAAGNITTRNVYAVPFPAAAFGGAYSFSCINFGFDNSGSYLEGEVAVWFDPDGGAPTLAGMDKVASFPVGLYSGAGQLVTVTTGEPICVELADPAATIVITLDIPASSDGFATFAGSLDSPNKTYIWSGGSCGFTDFVDLSTIGTPPFQNKWFVQLSGNSGCNEPPPPCPSDLNGDGQVGGADLGILLQNWGNPFGGADLGAMLQSWGACP